MNEIKFIDLFGGIGGFHLGLERANNIIRSAQQKNSKECDNPKNKLDNRELFSCVEKASGKRDKESRSGSTNINRELSTQRRSKPTFNCVWYCDKDKYTCQTYNKNFKEQWQPTDITTVKQGDIPDFDMLCAGFPCQSFSIAGKRKGFQDIRGTMFFEICRIAQAKRPRLLFLENVKGLLSADDGRCFGTILTHLDELGYDVEWQVLNSKNFGVPQNRERVFIIGHLRGSGGEQVFPLRQDVEMDTKTLREKEQTVPCLESTGYKGVSSERFYGIADFRYDEGLRMRNNQLSPCLFDQAKGGGLSNDLFVFSRPHGFNKGNLKEYVNIRFSAIQNELLNGIRRLTPIECERLQGFPDNWTNGISDTQRYKQLGNAVTVNVIQAIGEKILTNLN